MHTDFGILCTFFVSKEYLRKAALVSCGQTIIFGWEISHLNIKEKRRSGQGRLRLHGFIVVSCGQTLFAQALIDKRRHNYGNIFNAFSQNFPYLYYACNCALKCR